MRLDEVLKKIGIKRIVYKIVISYEKDFNISHYSIDSDCQ